MVEQADNLTMSESSFQRVSRIHTDNRIKPETHIQPLNPPPQFILLPLFSYHCSFLPTISLILKSLLLFLYLQTPHHLVSSRMITFYQATNLTTFTATFQPLSPIRAIHHVIKDTHIIPLPNSSLCSIVFNFPFQQPPRRLVLIHQLKDITFLSHFFPNQFRVTVFSSNNVTMWYLSE